MCPGVRLYTLIPHNNYNLSATRKFPLHEVVDIVTRIFTIKGFVFLPVGESSFEIHCPLDHLQSPLHQVAPLPCGHLAHEFAWWFPQLTGSPLPVGIVRITSFLNMCLNKAIAFNQSKIGKWWCII